MWIWLASLGILIICFIFAWKVMASSYNIFSNDKTLFMFKSFTPSDMSYFQETLRAVKSKLKALEDQSAYYELQFTRIHEKLNQLEQSHPQATGGEGKSGPQDEEDWKELFYEENEKKEKLENELDATQQELEAVKEELSLIKKSMAGSPEMKSDYDARLQEIQSLQGNILDLQKNLEGSAQREKELEIQLQQEKEARRQMSEKESEFISLKSDFDSRLQEIQSLQNNILDLQRSLEGAAQREKEMEIQLQKETDARQSEANREQEFDSLKKEYESRLGEIQSLQNTIQDLQKHLEESSRHQQELEIRLQQESEAHQAMANRESEFISLKNENEGLKKQITEMAMKQDEVEKKLLQFDELKNKLNTYEEEKSRMIADLETVLRQTRAFNQ